jgi:hypothetical protein
MFDVSGWGERSFVLFALSLFPSRSFSVSFLSQSRNVTRAERVVETLADTGRHGGEGGFPRLAPVNGPEPLCVRIR